MKNLKRVVVITIAIICGIQSMSGCQKMKMNRKNDMGKAVKWLIILMSICKTYA